MKLTKTQLTKLIRESLTGRSLERVAKRIAYDIFEYLKSEEIQEAFKEQTQGRIGFIVETELPSTLEWLDRVIVIMYPSSRFNSAAKYEYDLNATDEQRKNSDLVIELKMPVNYMEQSGNFWNKFRHDVESDINHELVHSGQPTEELMDLHKTIKSQDDIWATLDNAFKYYADKTEVPAYTSGWILKAKRTHQKIDDILYEELYKIYSTGLYHGYSESDMAKFINELSRVYYNYMTRRWPNME